jgi:hypothetical protein
VRSLLENTLSAIPNLSNAMSTTGYAYAPSILAKVLLGNLEEVAYGIVGTLYLRIHVSVIFTLANK